MEFTQDQLIDFGLNLAGYLAAVLFSLIIFGIYFGRKLGRLSSALKATAYPNSMEGVLAGEPGSATPQHQSGAAAVRTAAEFYGFGHVPGSDATECDHAEPDRFSRNRADVIRLAKGMLAAGNSSERVADLLPISESEMHLVKLGSRDNHDRR